MYKCKNCDGEVRYQNGWGHIIATGCIKPSVTITDWKHYLETVKQTDVPSNEVIDTGQQLDMFGGKHQVEVLGKGKPKPISLDNLLALNKWNSEGSDSHD